MDDFIQHIFRHGTVNVTGEFNKTCVMMIGARLPREILRIYGNAVAARAGPRIKRHKPERFRSGGINNLPHIQPHFIADECHFVDEPDVDTPEGIL